MRALTVKPLRAQLAWDSGDGIAGEETGLLEPAGEPAGTVAWRQWMQERQDMFIYDLTIYDLGLRWHRNIRDGGEEFEGVGCDARVRFGDM